MINIHAKYDNIHKNEMFYSLIYINKHIISCINYMLLVITPLGVVILLLFLDNGLEKIL